MSSRRDTGPLHLRVPATSANLGPGFDTLALALAIYLEIEAEASDAFSIEATGRNADQCGVLEGNLILNTYRELMASQNRAVVPLRIRANNGIPLGMGCGSSAAARVTGVALAAHFGELKWDRKRIFEEAARLEGHPDNAASCVLGGFTVSGATREGFAASVIAPSEEWCAVVAISAEPLATSASRGVLPEMYSRADVVRNLQCVGLLAAGFTQQDMKLVRAGMHDRVHEPYRAKVCPLLPALQPLAEHSDVIGVALSGAGPSVLVLCEKKVSHIIRDLVHRSSAVEVEVIVTPLDSDGLRGVSYGLPLW